MFGPAPFPSRHYASRTVPDLHIALMPREPEKQYLFPCALPATVVAQPSSSAASKKKKEKQHPARDWVNSQCSFFWSASASRSPNQTYHTHNNADAKSTNGWLVAADVVLDKDFFSATVAIDTAGRSSARRARFDLVNFAYDRAPVKHKIRGPPPFTESGRELDPL